MQILVIILWLGIVLGKEAKEVLEAIQKYRAKHNLPILKVSPALVRIAQDRAESILSSGSLFNQNTDISSLAESYGYQVFSIGENIGKSVNREGNGMDIFKEWINSPVHRENITDAKDYTHIGVYKIIGEYNIYVSAIFARPDTQSSAEKPEKLEKSDNLDNPDNLNKQNITDTEDRKRHRQGPLSITSTHHMSHPPAASNTNNNESTANNDYRKEKNFNNFNNLNNSKQEKDIYNTSNPVKNQHIPYTPQTEPNNHANIEYNRRNIQYSNNSINKNNSNISSAINPSGNNTQGKSEKAYEKKQKHLTENTNKEKAESTLLVTLPEDMQKEDIVLKLVFTKKNTKSGVDNQTKNYPMQR